jgi:formate dehydrogenase iron-sulfur subunit
MSCAIACKKANNLPDAYSYSAVTNGNTWTTVKLQKDIPGKLGGLNVKIQCMHCSDPSCVAVCPTGAAYKREDGIVLIDQDTCIGCKYCAVACPFNVPGVSNLTGTSRKCIFCVSRLAEGKATVCSEACPVGATQFGNVSDLLARASDRIDQLKKNGFTNANLYGQKELGGLKVMYILPDKPEAVGFPNSPRQANADSLTKWFAGLATAGLLAAIPLRNVFTGQGDEDTSKPGEVKKNA